MLGLDLLQSLWTQQADRLGAVYHPVGRERVERRSARQDALHRLRRKGRHHNSSELERRTSRRFPVSRVTPLRPKNTNAATTWAQITRE